MIAAPKEDYPLARVVAGRRRAANIMRWLLNSDPSIRWQVMHDLAGAPPDVVAAERSRVASEGWGAALLARQSDGGYWGDADDEGWMSTTDALVLLKELGADPHDERVRRSVGLVRDRITWWQLDGRPYFHGETEPCINGAILAAGAYFGMASDRLVERLLGEQLYDGGWNCDAPPSVRSSFHSTIRVLEGLLEYEKMRGVTAEVTRARTRGERYLLERHMLRSLTSGEIIDRRWTRFSFPTTWHYDVLRGLEYLRTAGVEPHDELAEAIEVVEQRRHQNGRWPMNHLHSDRLAFAIEPKAGSASRWNTLRALRVLDWYQNSAAPKERSARPSTR